MLRQDDLENGYRLWQDPQTFCFGIDAVLLANFGKLRAGDRVGDFCTGNGVIPHLLAADARDAGISVSVTGLELQQKAAELARRSVRDNGLADAALGAFCIWPHRYALVTLDSGQKLRYEARALDESNLPGNFLQVSREWFAGITRDKVTASLTGTGKEIRLMADYAARFNLAYFSGTYRKNDVSWTEDPAFALWQNQAGSAFWQYMKTVMNESAEDPLHWEEAR